MIGEDQIRAAKERIPLDQLIGRDVALRRHGREFTGLCPFHSEKSPSFTVVPWKGFFHCFGCGAHGSAIDYLMRSRRLDFPAAVRELLGLPINAPMRRPAPQEAARTPEREPDVSEYVATILRQAGPVSPQTAAWLYLWTRGLDVHQPALRAHPDLWCKEAQRKYPALIAPVKTSQGHVTAIQRIYCLPRADSEAKDSRAPLKGRKLSLGHLYDGCVRLAAAAPVMGIAEGVETAIAAAALYMMPVWATLGAARMATVWIPEDVEQLVIFADIGVAGEAAAERARMAHEGRGIACSVVPSECGDDFNDQERAYLDGMSAAGYAPPPARG